MQTNQFFFARVDSCGTWNIAVLPCDITYGAKLHMGILTSTASHDSFSNGEGLIDDPPFIKSIARLKDEQEVVLEPKIN